jgi:glyoxylase-like metal-dependent hydrolase (beta-lactamase superfamily II)
MTGPRVFVAENAGPFTLGGTRTFVLGRRHVAVVDPGPDDRDHLEGVAAAVARATEGVILVTHGHPDHAGGAGTLARLTGFPVAGNIPGVDRTLSHGDRIPVDEGELEVVDTPGHARRHLSFLHHPSRELFVGDLLLGHGETSWVGEYPGCVADYLASLDRIQALRPSRIHPAHGPPLDDPEAAIARFRDHRLMRLQQVREALEAMGVPLGEGGAGKSPGTGEPGLGSGGGGFAAGEPGSAVGGPNLDPDALVDQVVARVYGAELPPGVQVAARWSARALLEYLDVLPFPPEGAPTEEGNRLAGGS